MAVIYEVNMSWEENVRLVTPYVPGEQPKEKNIIKLNTNENPYPPSPEAAKVLKGFDAELLKKYPDPNVTLLRESIAKYHGVKTSQVFAGVGSDDVLGMAFLTFFGGEEPVLFPDLTYSFYPVWSELYRIPFTEIPLDDTFRIRPSDYRIPCGGVIFPNPNAPTGIYETKEVIREILNDHPDVVVIVDEAYIDFAGENASVLDLIPEYENLLVTRTFSKSRSMAGARIAYAVGSEKLIDYLMAIRNSYNSYTMNSVSIAAGVASVEDDGYFRESVEKIKTTRDRFTEEIRTMGFTVLPSSANFVFAAPPAPHTAEEVFLKAREKGIYFRHFSSLRANPYLRITIGTDEEMDQVLRFFREEI